jgi:hypothetical protein
MARGGISARVLVNRSGRMRRTEVAACECARVRKESGDGVRERRPSQLHSGSSSWSDADGGVKTGKGGCLKAGIQRESSSQGSRREDAERIRQPGRGRTCLGRWKNSRRLTLRMLQK